ncbi:intermembrane phospholipid transport protein YdbH family protein, partial [Allosphingosinicella sp.]|uniref:intermembrane phospholipid transport protein YdbH family protein n=1 Tax=Allosphingosinicella sp. TaxID=2823234 RepID=UPI002EECB6C5
SGAVHHLDIAEIDGRFASGGAAGTYRGLSGKVARVPILFSESSGRWQVQRGDLLLTGRVMVADEMVPPRFEPLVSDDFRLTLAENRVHALGWLNHPASGTRVTHATIDHDLRSGVGGALLDVPGIAFTLDGLQPEDISRRTVGVVALVEGTLRGRGEIGWRPGATTSTGTFSTEDMNLAASFGPVEGLSTTVHFTDLLALASAPGQVATIDLIRAGIDVADGTIHYQLLPNSHVQIESGRWPFAGGELLLQPSLLDFSRPSTKYLTFDVLGLNAATFTEQLGFDSIELTGLFDGVLPMRFDVRGGHIVGGKLRARPGGGMLSYTGLVSDQALGTYGKLAFDALRSLRYSQFYIQLDGALAGEFLTRIQLDGITVAGRQHWLLRQLANIPFRFNIAIRGPLRAVIATARATSDPTILIQPVLPEELQGLPTTVTRIDTEESETSNATDE